MMFGLRNVITHNVITHNVITHNVITHNVITYNVITHNVVNPLAQSKDLIFCVLLAKRTCDV